MLKPTLFVVGLSVLAISVASSARATEHGVVDVTGDWRVDIEQDGRRCRWQGQVHLDQEGVQLTGSGEASAPPAQRFCPNLRGEVEGSVNGPRVKFGFATGRLGTGEFDGALAPGGRALRGTWSAGRASGVWRAERMN